ncbi:MAG: TlpA family protein disulfide reductase [Sedimentisphaerales bacterium]
MATNEILKMMLTSTIGVLIFFFASCHGAQERQADLFPSYKLKAGDMLTYESSSEFKYGKGSLLSGSESQIWVLRRNENDSWHLLARNETSYGSGTSARKSVSLAIFDLFPNGRIDSGPYPSVRNAARSCFITLPSDSSMFKTTWQAYDKEQNEKHIYSYSTQSKPHKGRWVFQKVTTSRMNDIYGMSETSTVYFNTKKSLVEKIESSYLQTYGLKGKGTGIAKLKSVKTMEPDFINLLSADAETYFKSSKDYTELLSSLAEHPDSLETKLTEAKNILLSAKYKLSHPVIMEQLNSDLAEHDKRINYLTERAKQQAAILNQPSPAWKTVDFKGQTYSIEALRGKVVLLDFWYRGCGWCIRAMPQIKKVADYFANQPVVVLGMNIDRDPANAEFVIEKMGLNYPNLKAKGIPEKYGVRGYPTLIVIDQSGIVKSFHVGYSPHLRNDLIRSVEKLLSPKPNKSIDANNQ